VSTRASDAEREAAVTRLREAAGEGRLSVQELADRIDAAYAATTLAELEPLTSDLPAPAPAERGPRTSFVLGVLGGGDRRGRWRVADRVTVVNVLGGADLDLRQALLAGPEVQITVLSLLGGSDITVPEGVHVELSGFALLGGNDLRVDPTHPEPPPGAPTVHVRAYSILGGTDVLTKRGRKRTPPAPPELPRLP
jgi:uncharacterized protein DUF1707/cell wall-active antibiotic response 4TMS protein YvqF